MVGTIYKDRIFLKACVSQEYSCTLEHGIGVEIFPLHGHATSDLSKWEFVVDKRNLPEWYKVNSHMYEMRFRLEVENWLNTNTVNIEGEN